MDPLSITASIFALLQGAQSGAQGLRKLKWYWKSAAGDLENLASEVESTTASLQDVQSFLERNESREYCASLSLPVERAAKTINLINNILVSPSLKPSRLNQNNQARLIWLRHGTDARSLREDLRVVKLDLVVQLSVVHASSTGRVERSLDQVSAQMATIVQKMATLDPASQWSSQIPSSTWSEDESSGAQAQHDEKLIASSTSTSGDLSLDKDLEDSIERPSNVYELSDSPTRQSCPPWCSCRCHVRRTLRSPWVLSCYVGEVRIQYDGTRPECNERKCVRSSNSSFNLTYRFPRYLLHRYVSTTAHFHPINSPRFSLRVPRVMPWAHLLWYYASNQETGAIQRLFSEGKASPYDMNLRGSNALIYAAGHSDIVMCRFLIQQGIDPEAPNEGGKSPSRVMWENAFAGEYGDQGISIVDTRNFSIIHKIVLGILFDTLESELEKSTATIDQGDIRGRTPLCWAVIRNDFSAVKTLLAYDANPNALDDVGKSPLDFVSSVEICEALLNANVHVHHRSSVYRQGALHRLCKGPGTADVVDVLVNAGIHVDVRDEDEETPLLNAIYNGCLDAARRLIDLGADVSAANKSSRDNAIHFATSFDRYPIIPHLINAGADYRPSNKYGRNAIHMAARFASTKTMQALTEAKLRDLDPAAQDEEGKTAKDYIAERTVLTEREKGLHEQFAALIDSLGAPGCSELETGRIDELVHDESIADAMTKWKLPGAYPENTE